MLLSILYSIKECLNKICPKKFKCVCNYDCLTKKSNINDRNTIYIKINKQNIFKVINIWTCTKNINKINIPWKKNITC